MTMSITELDGRLLSVSATRYGSRITNEYTGHRRYNFGRVAAAQSRIASITACTTVMLSRSTALSTELPEPQN